MFNQTCIVAYLYIMYVLECLYIEGKNMNK